MMAKCIGCKCEEGDDLYFDGRMDRPRPAKLVNSRYGKLCQRCAKNAYARGTTAKKRKSKRKAEHEEMIVQSGQLSMFEDGE